MIPGMFDPQFYAPNQQAGLLQNILPSLAPVGMLSQGQPQGFPQMPQEVPQQPTDISAAQAQPMQIAPQQHMQPQMQQAEQPSFWGSLSNGLANNSNALMLAGASLASGGGIGGALTGFATGGQLDQKSRNTNQTVEFLKKRGMSETDARAAASNPTILQSLLSNKTQTDDIREFEYAKGQGFTGSFSDWQIRKRAGAGEYALQPTYGVDKDGNPVIMQLGKTGEAVQSRLPPGVKFSKEPIKLDAGTHFVLLDPISRQQVGIIPKNVAGAAAEKAQGTAQGGAASMLPAAETMVNNALQTIDKLEKHPGLDWGAGASGIVAGRIPGTAAYDFQALNKQAQGQSFMAAREALKGAGQVTDFEGLKGEQAISNLDTAQSKEQYLEALKNLRRMMQSSIADLRKKANQPAAPGVQQPATPGRIRIDAQGNIVQ